MIFLTPLLHLYLLFFYHKGEFSFLIYLFISVWPHICLFYFTNILLLLLLILMLKLSPRCFMILGIKLRASSLLDKHPPTKIHFQSFYILLICLHHFLSTLLLSGRVTSPVSLDPFHEEWFLDLGVRYTDWYQHVFALSYFS
jgi:hypothetical protein